MKGASLGLLTGVAATLLLLLLLRVESTGAEDVAAVPEAVIKQSADLSQAEENRERIFFGSQSTITYTVVQLSTSTVFFTCLSGTLAAPVCQGRRKRKDVNLMQEFSDVGDGMELETSLDQQSAAERVAVEDPDSASPGSNKLAWTLWTTAKTTTTLTTFSTNDATTVQVSYYCNVGNIQYPSFPCP